MAILVTGATGFVGINLVKMIAAQGRDVVGLYRTPYDDFEPWFLGEYWESTHVKMVRGDITSDATIEELRDYGITGIIHSAVVTPSPEMERDYPEMICNVNVMGTVKLLELARTEGMKRFVYVSSSGVYGDTGDNETLVSEDLSIVPHGLYGVTKYCSEGVTGRYGEIYDMYTASARIGAPYGPGERPTKSRTIMSPLCVMASQAALGQSVTLANPDIARDWTHVNDTCAALLALYDGMPLRHALFNVSLGRSENLWQAAEILQSLLSDAQFSEVPEDAADTGMSRTNRRGPMSVQRLIDDSGFEPSISLREGLEDYVNWLQRYQAWSQQR